MRLAELIGRLEGLQTQHGGDVEVRIAIPRAWPLVAPVADVRYLDDEVDPDTVRRVVWISGE